MTIIEFLDSVTKVITPYCKQSPTLKNRFKNIETLRRKKSVSMDDLTHLIDKCSYGVDTPAAHELNNLLKKVEV